MIYHNFAQLYDQLFDADLYQKWEQYTIANCPTSTKKVLDLAGGAGRLAVLLVKDGLDVTVADFSVDMLTLAQTHAQTAGVPLQLVQADMRNLDQFPQYDLITCYADSLCYLEDITDVVTTFKQVYQHLNSQGYFLFDMITPYQTDEIYPGYTYNFEDDQHQRALLWQSFQNDEVEHGVIHELAIFNRLTDGKYERVGETHFERAYPLELVMANLKRVGFTKITVTADFGHAQPNAQTTRWFFKCQK